MTLSINTKLSRRQALVALGMLAASCQTKKTEASEPITKKDTKGIALQLYTMRDPAKKDLPGTLKKVREMGWEYVQWSGMPDLPAAKMREVLDAAGLKAISSHCGVEPFETDFDNQVAFWKTVGVQMVGPGGMMKDCQTSHDAWLQGAARLDAIGAKLRGVGLRLSYHNHAGEFEKFPGDEQCKLDLLYAATKPENLFAELDLAWVLAGGADPAAYVRKYAKRCPNLHAKDLATNPKDGGKVRFAPLGKGVLDWPDIFAAGREAGVEWYIYEQDNCEGDPFGCAKISLEFLAKNLL